MFLSLFIIIGAVNICNNGYNGGCSENAVCTVGPGGLPECTCTEAGFKLTNQLRVCVGK